MAALDPGVPLPPPPPTSTTTRRTTTTTRRAPARTARTSTAAADARTVLASTLVGDWGLATSALDWAYGQLKAGHSVEAIMANLQTRPEFKRRFPGIDARRRNGLSPISVSEYLQTERAYKQVFRSAGLPYGYYDKPDDFTGYVANDVSPNELQNRVQNVYETLKADMPQVRQALQDYYGVKPSDGTLLAYALNPAKGLDVIQREVAAAEVGGAAAAAGITESRARAVELANAGVSFKEAEQGFSAVSGELSTQQRQVGATQGPLSQQQLEQEAFAGDQVVAQKRKRRAAEAAGLFQAGGGVAASSKGLVGLGETVQ